MSVSGSPAGRRLIVNADDFGQSHGINRGVVEAHVRGIVTSASLMVRWPAAAEAALLAKRLPELSIGLHVDLGEWEYRDGAWRALYDVVSTEDEDAVRQEVAAQIVHFRDLVGRNPSHLDSHQHVHRRPPVRDVMADLATELAVPLRDLDASIRYRGDFYGQASRGEAFPCGISVANLIRLLADLSPGTTELSCHPADASDVRSPYGEERQAELATLTDTAVLGAISALGIDLVSFKTLAPARAGQTAEGDPPITPERVAQPPWHSSMRPCRSQRS